MDKLTKFYKDNRDDLLVAAATVGLSSAALMAQIARGLMVKSVCHHADDEGEVIVVYLMNGFQRTFHKVND